MKLDKSFAPCRGYQPSLLTDCGLSPKLTPLPSVSNMRACSFDNQRRDGFLMASRHVVCQDHPAQSGVLPPVASGFGPL